MYCHLLHNIILQNSRVIDWITKLTEMNLSISYINLEMIRNCCFVFIQIWVDFPVNLKLFFTNSEWLDVFKGQWHAEGRT